MVECDMDVKCLGRGFGACLDAFDIELLEEVTVVFGDIGMLERAGVVSCLNEGLFMMQLSRDMTWSSLTPSPVSDDVLKWQYQYFFAIPQIFSWLASTAKSFLQPTMQMYDDSSILFSAAWSHLQSFYAESGEETSQQTNMTLAFLQQLGCREKYFY